MKLTFILALCLLSNFALIAQSFEGKLTYSVSYEVDEKQIGGMGIPKESVIEKMKSERIFYDQITMYLKNGNYVSIDNSEMENQTVYNSEENLIYGFQKDAKYASVLNAAYFSPFGNSFPKPEVLKSDSTKMTQGDTCHLLILKWEGIGEEHYWYDKDKLAINPALFERHNLNYLNLVLKETKSYPVEITKSMGYLLQTTMTLQKYEEIEVDEAIFHIPELKETKKKIPNIGGESKAKLMKIKN